MIVKVLPAQIAQLFNDAGFKSKVIKNDQTEMVQTIFWSEDVFSGAIPQACEKDGSGCHAIEIFANLGSDSGVDDAWINAWNAQKLYVRAFKSDKGDLIFELDVGLFSGASAEYIKNCAQVFKRVVDTSSDFKP